jgi:hypothetical protein
LDEVVGAPNTIGQALGSLSAHSSTATHFPAIKIINVKQLLKSQGGDTHVRRVSSDP